MRVMLINHIADEDGAGRNLLDLTLGALTAEPITNAFFATCRTVGALDKNEQTIEACLRKAILAECKRRNDVVHGDWIFGGLGGIEKPVLIRVQAGSVKEPFRVEEYDAERIEAMCGDVELLHNAAWEFAAIIFSTGSGTLPRRVRDALHVVDGRIAFRPGIDVPRWNI